jgi:hypothetical protein
VTPEGKRSWVSQPVPPRYLEWSGDRGRGTDHHAAVRALAFKWIRIAFRCWKHAVPYDDARYMQSLRRRGSPLIAALAKPELP